MVEAERHQSDMHLDEETLARFAEGRLDADQRGRALDHLAGCDECVSIAAAVEREARDPSRGVELGFDVLRSRPTRGWWIQAAAAAAVVALVVLWFMNRPQPKQDPGFVQQPEPKTSDVPPPPPSTEEPPLMTTDVPAPPVTKTPAPRTQVPPPPTTQVPPSTRSVQPPPPPTTEPSPPKEPPRRTYAWQPPVLANISGPLKIRGTDGKERDAGVVCALKAGELLRTGDGAAAFQIVGSAEAALASASEVEVGIDGDDLRVIVKQGRAFISGRLELKGARDVKVSGLVVCSAGSVDEADASAEAEYAQLKPKFALVAALVMSAPASAYEIVAGTRDGSALVGRSSKGGTAVPVGIWLRPAVKGARLTATVRTNAKSVEVTLRTSTNRASRVAAIAKDGRIEIELPAGEAIEEVTFTPSIESKSARPWIELEAIEVVR